jgi:osmotically-inducible protein OsmY
VPNIYSPELVDERDDRQGRGGRWGSQSDDRSGRYGAGERGYGGSGRGDYGRYESDYGDYGYGGGRDRDRDYGFGASAGYRGQGYGGYGYGYGGAQWSERDRYGREESRERGFLERAGDEVASWFGDEEAARRRRQDAREGDWSAGQHRGRGPKGYSRSDDRIREDVSDRLTDDPHIDASDIEVSVSGGEVTLSGTVDSRFAKRHAEDLAEAVSGVRHVQNNLRVRQSTTGSWSGSSSSAGSAGTAGSSGTGTTGGTAGTGTTGTASGTSVFGGSGRA